MLAAKPVILALHDEKRPATQFLAAAQAASVDVKLPCLAEMALYRELNHLAEAEHYEAYFSILSGKAEPDAIKICQIPEDKREGLIIRSTIKVISDLSRQENKIGQMETCIGIAQKTFSDVASLRATEQGRELLADLEAVWRVTQPMQDGLDDKELLDARRLINAKAHRFYKPFALFPTGQQVLQRAAEASQARARDAGFMHDLQEAMEQAATLPEKTSVKVAGKQVTINDVTVYKKLFEWKAKLDTNASDRFKLNNNDKLELLATKLGKLVEDIQGLTKESQTSIFEKMLTHFTEAWGCKASVTHYNDAADEVMNNLPDPKVFLKGLVCDAAMKPFSDNYDQAVGVAQLLRSVFPAMMNQTWTLGAEDANLIALFELVYDSSGLVIEWLSATPGYTDFKTATAERLWQVLITGLRANFPVKDLVPIFEAWDGDDAVKSWLELTVQNTTAEIKAAAALGRRLRQVMS